MEQGENKGEELVEQLESGGKAEGGTRSNNLAPVPAFQTELLEWSGVSFTKGTKGMFPVF